MANQFVTIKDFARAAMPRLIEHLVFPNLIHKDYSDDFAARKGDTIQVRKPVVLEARDFDPDQGVVAEDIVESTVDVTLDRIATVDVGIEALQGATSIDDLTRVFIDPAAAALAQKINADGLQLYRDVYAAVGEAGKTPSSLADFAAARKQLNLQKVPVSGRVAVWDTEADAAFIALDPIVHAEKSGSTQALREGSIGRIMGMENYMSQAVKYHETGITAAQAVKVNGKVEAGSASLSLIGSALTGKLVKGDLIKIGENTYTVTADSAPASGNAISDVSLSPCLPEIADKTDVTLVGSHTANLAFHPMAFAFVTRPLPAPGGVESYVTHYNGVSLRVVRGYDMQHKREMLSMDVLYGFKTLYPELAVRVLG
ncbi:MAG: P22 coat protein [Clostridiales bacterium]|nr:P22 coat protein [Clostridiales bacterium]